MKQTRETNDAIALHAIAVAQDMARPDDKFFTHKDGLVTTVRLAGFQRATATIHRKPSGAYRALVKDLLGYEVCVTQGASSTWKEALAESKRELLRRRAVVETRKLN